VIETPLYLCDQKENDCKIFNTILDIALLSGYWNGQGVYFGKKYLS